MCINVNWDPGIPGNNLFSLGWLETFKQQHPIINRTIKAIEGDLMNNCFG